MLPSPTQHASVYTDFNGLNKLKSAAAKDTPEARRETAQQFEAMFIQMMLKTMRQASEGDELLGGSQVEMSRDMYDKQLSIELSKNGAIGIGDLMLKQMGELPNTTATTSLTDALNAAPKTDSNSLQAQNIPLEISTRLSDSGKATRTPAPSAEQQTPQGFIRQLHSDAQITAEKLGTKPEAILAIAALETGWGQHVIPTLDGGSSNNLFGIKADKNWNNEQIVSTTLEFEDGVMQKRQEPFRQYASTQESMQDFADFLMQNPRYKTALAKADNPQNFIEELHKAGYATDPDYTDKVLAVMNKIKPMTQDMSLLADNKVKEIKHLRL